MLFANQSLLIAIDKLYYYHGVPGGGGGGGWGVSPHQFVGKTKPVGQYWLIIKINETNSINFVGNSVKFVGNMLSNRNFS